MRLHAASLLLLLALAGCTGAADPPAPPDPIEVPPVDQTRLSITNELEHEATVWVKRLGREGEVLSADRVGAQGGSDAALALATPRQNTTALRLEWSASHGGRASGGTFRFESPPDTCPGGVEVDVRFHLQAGSITATPERRCAPV